jgi:hypothetical protein
VGHSVNYNKSVMGLAIVASDSESLILPMKIKRRGGRKRSSRNKSRLIVLGQVSASGGRACSYN